MNSYAPENAGCEREESHANGVGNRVLKAYAQGGIKACPEEEVVLKYAPLALKMVYRIAPMTGSYIDLDDLKNIAYFALVQAVRSFHPEFGVAFEVHCRTRIRGAILDELRKSYPVSRTFYAKWKELERIIQELAGDLGHQPSETEVASKLGISVEAYRERLDDLKLVAFVSLEDATWGANESDDCPRLQLEDPTQMDPSDLACSRDLEALVRNRLLEMPPRQRKVLSLYYYEGLRFKDIAELLKVSESRVCQIHTEAIVALRAFIDRKENFINTR